MGAVTVKVRITRPLTIAEPPVHVPGNGDPPTFAIGDEVEVYQALAQQLVGSGRAEFVKGVLNDPAPYEEQPKVEAAAMEAPEAAVTPPATRKKAT